MVKKKDPQTKPQTKPQTTPPKPPEKSKEEIPRHRLEDPYDPAYAPHKVR